MKNSLSLSQSAKSLQLQKTFLKTRVLNNANLLRQRTSHNRRHLSAIEDLRFLQGYQNRLTHASSDLLLQNLLCLLSPFFARAFSICQWMNVEIQPLFQTHTQMVQNFDPFQPKVCVQGFGSALDVLYQRPLDEIVFRETSALLSLHIGVFHDVLHGIFTRLIPPPTKINDLQDYLYFIESLVFATERYPTLELGPLLTRRFIELGCLTFDFARDPLVTAGKNQPEMIFLLTWTNWLYRLHGITPKQANRLSKTSLPFVQTPQINPSAHFLKEVVQPSMKVLRKAPYPSSWRNPKKDIRKAQLRLEHFSLPYLVRPEIQTLIHDWYLQLWFNRDLF